MFCFGCGNEIPEGEECPVCAAGRAVRRPARPPAPQSPEGPRRPEPEKSTHLCRGCGNDVPVDEDCPICAAARARRESQAARTAEARTQFCRSCGNEVPAGRPCPVCEESRTRQKDLRPTAPCPRCGNEVEDVQHCPICAAARGADGGSAGAPTSAGGCPRCADPLESQDWDGIAVLMCPTCQGSLFPPGGLEKTLDKLREAKEETKLAEVLREFKDRLQGKLAAAVRYKHCPVCAALMTRRNYMGISGIVVDVCAAHGTWVDQAAFGDLAAFISRGGDVLAARHTRKRR